MKWKLADGTEVELGDVTLEALFEADPALKEAHGKSIKEAIDKRFKAQKKAEPQTPPAEPVIPPEVQEQLKELEELRSFKQAAEDAKKTDAQRAQDALLQAQQVQAKIRADEAKKVEAERHARELAENKLREHLLDSQIAAWLGAKNKGIGIAHIPALVRTHFKEIEGKFVAENPETGELVGVEDYLPAYLRQPGNEVFLPPPLPGSGQQPGKPGAKVPENLTPGQWLARAVAERVAAAPPGESLKPAAEGPKTGQ